MNTSILCFLSAAVFCIVVADKSDTCHNQMKDFGTCLEKKFKDNQDADDKRKEEIKNKASKCFTENKCQAPDYDAEPKIGGRLKQQFDNTPTAVKDCLKKEAKKAGLETLNKCLKDKNVKPLDEPEAEDDDVFEEKLKGGDKDKSEKLGKTIINVGLALKKCKSDSGDEAVKKVKDCMKPVKEEIKKEICTRVNDCKKDKVTDEACKKRGKEVEEATCQCQKDKIKESLKKVEELQKKDGDVEMSDLKDLAAQHPEAGGMGANLDKVEQCYKDNNTPLPPFFAFIKGGPGGNGAPPLFAALKPKVTKDQLQDIHDLLQHKLDEPCGCN